MSELPPPGTPFAMYSRYSTKWQDYRSIAGQEMMCSEYALSHGWVEAGRFSDAERSGTTTVGRAGLFEMLAAAERGEFRILVVEDLDRPSRDAADMHTIAKELEELEIVLCTVSGGVVTKMELAFKAVQNSEYVKQNALKSKRGQELVVRGGRMSGSVAYGYRKVIMLDGKGEPINGLREIVPELAVVVVRIYRDFDAGMSTFEICKVLNSEGIPSPGGKQWRPGALLGNRNGSLGILRNPIYRGEYHFRKTARKRRKGVMKTRFTSENERIVTEQPDLAIVDQDLWDRVQTRLADNFDKPFHTKKKAQYLLTGKVSCGVCGSGYAVADGKFACTGHQFKGVCSNPRRLAREVLETTILDRIKDHLLSRDLMGPCLAAYREEAQHALAEQAAKARSASARLKEIEQRIANLVTQLGASSEVSFMTKVMGEEINSLGAERARLEHQVKAVPCRSEDATLDADTALERIRATLDGLQEALEGDDREAVRACEIVRNLVSRVVLTPPEGSSTDGRGAGDLLVTVEGPLAALIELADMPASRVAKHEHRPTFVLDSATLTYRFGYRLEWRDPRLGTVYADVATAAKLLDESAVPVTVERFNRAFLDGLADQRPNAQPVHLRVRNVLAYLKDRGLIRAIQTRRPTSGYVWNETGLSDDEWKARIRNPPMSLPMPTIRVKPVEAIVVVVGPCGERQIHH